MSSPKYFYWQQRSKLKYMFICFSPLVRIKTKSMLQVKTRKSIYAWTNNNC